MGSVGNGLRKIRRSRDQAWASSVLFLLFLGSAILCHHYNYAPAGLVSFWLPGGVALATYLLVSHRQRYLLGLLYFAIDLSLTSMTTADSRVVVLSTLLRAAAPALAAWAIRSYLHRRPQMERLPDLLIFLSLPLLLIYPAGAALTGVLLRESVGLSVWMLAREYWMSQLLGSVLIAPLILSWAQQNAGWGERFNRRKMRDHLPLLLALMTTVLFIFSREHAEIAAQLHYLVYPIWLLAAVQFGPRGAPLIAVLVIVLAFSLSTLGYGPFALIPQREPYLQILILSIFLSVGLVSSLLLIILTYQRRDAQRQHRESQALLEGLVANIPAAIYIKDIQGRYLLANRCMELLLGQPSRAVVGRTDFDLMGREAAQRIEAHDKAILREGELVRLEEEVELDDKTLSMKTIKFPLYQSSGGTPVLCGISSDITHLKELETERLGILQREQQARLQAESLFQEAQRLNRLKDEFLMTLSHELRIPLHGILGWTQILCDQKTDLEQRNLAFRNLQRSVEAESRVIDELLDISRILSQKISMDMQWLKLDKVLTKALSAVEHAAREKGLQLDHLCEQKYCVLRGDSRRLEQILINILLNAIKFTPSGGRIRVELKLREGEAIISVQDNGIGIGADHLQHIFKRFWQADSSLSRKFGGLGLGLALVQELVALHGGSIDAESAGEGLGATFTLRLPLAEAPALEVIELARDEEVETEFDLRQLRLLAIDDDPATCKLLSILFADEFREMKTAHSADEAMHLLAQWRPDFILCDIAMPGEDGISFIKRARVLASASDWTIHAAALSANADETNIRTALLEGFDAFLTKPVDPGQIIRVVRRLCSPHKVWPYRTANPFHGYTSESRTAYS